MNQKYFPAFDILSKPNNQTNYFKYRPSSSNTSTMIKRKKLLGHLVKKLSLLISTKNQKIIDQFKNALECILLTYIKTREAILPDLFYFIELLYLVFNKNQKFWIKLRALYLTQTKQNKGNNALCQNLILRRALLSSPQEFQNSLANLQINSKKMYQMQYFHNPEKYTDKDINNLSVYSYLYLVNKNVIIPSIVQFNQEQWMVHKVFLERVILKYKTHNYQQILNMALEDPYDPKIQSFTYLKTTEEGERVFLRILLNKLKFCDDRTLWQQLLQSNYRIIQQQKLKQVIDLYQNYHLQIYLNNNLHSECNLQQIIQHLEVRSQQMNEISQQRSTVVQNIIEELKGLITPGKSE